MMRLKIKKKRKQKKCRRGQYIFRIETINPINPKKTCKNPALYEKTILKNI